MPTVIEVVTQKIIVNPPSGKIDIVGWGPAGPQGPPGPPGSGVNVAWPLVAPANSTGNVVFTKSGAINDIRGLTTPDAASWIRFWDETNTAIYIKANSGPLTGGLNGRIYLDGDEVQLRSSAGSAVAAIFRPLGAGAPHQSYKPWQITNNDSDELVKLGPSAGRSPYTSFYTDDGLRRGYVGYPQKANGYVYLVSEYGPLQVQGNGGVDLNAGGSGFRVVTDAYRIQFYSKDPAGAPYNVHMGEFYSDRAVGAVSGGGMKVIGDPVKFVRNTALEYGYVNDTGFVLHGNRSFYFAGWGGGWFMQDATWIRSNGDKSVWLGGGTFGNDGYLTMGRGGGTDGTWRFWCAYNGRFGGTLYGDGEISGNYVKGRKVAGGSWADQTVAADAGNTMVGYAWHPGGVAGCLRWQVNNARWHFNNLDGSWYYDCLSSGWQVASAAHGKQELVPFVDTLAMLPMNPVATMVRGLKPVWWKSREWVHMREVPVEHEGVHTDDYPIHVCRTEGPNACMGTEEVPCMWKQNWERGYLGFIAEEVEEVLPQLVRLDADLKPQSLDLGSLVGLAYAMLQELDSRLTALEERKAVA